MRRLPFLRPLAAKVQLMSLGDVLFRLSIVSPQDYHAIEVLARSALRKDWPDDGTDPVHLLEGQQSS